MSFCMGLAELRRTRGFGNHASEAPRPETPCQFGTPSLRIARIDRAETIAVAHQGVWHDRGNRAIADDVTLAADRGHRFGRSVAPPA